MTGALPLSPSSAIEARNEKQVGSVAAFRRTTLKPGLIYSHTRSLKVSVIIVNNSPWTILSWSEVIFNNNNKPLLKTVEIRF